MHSVFPTLRLSLFRPLLVSGFPESAPPLSKGIALLFFPVDSAWEGRLLRQFRFFSCSIASANSMLTCLPVVRLLVHLFLPAEDAVDFFSCKPPILPDRFVVSHGVFPGSIALIGFSLSSALRSCRRLPLFRQLFGLSYLIFLNVAHAFSFRF